MNSSPSEKTKHKHARRTVTPTAAIHNHHTVTPTAAVHHHNHTVTPTVAVHHHRTLTPTAAPTAHITHTKKVSDEIPEPEPIPPPANETWNLIIGEDPIPPPPSNQTTTTTTTMLAITPVTEEPRSGVGLTPFVFALPLLVLGAWFAQTKVRRYGYTPIRTVEFMEV